MRELELIDALHQVLEPAGPRIVRWLGDDAAVVRGAGYAVTSVDTMVDGVHFRLGQLTAAQIGRRAMAAALSDLAAMAVAPGEAYLSLGLPAELAIENGRELAAGAMELARETGTVIAGGDLTAAPVLIVSVTVTGWARDPALIMGRDGARPGDLVVVTGTLGGAGAGLALYEQRVPDDALATAAATALRRSYAAPVPRLAAGMALSAAGATAMIDLSDGIATDARHLARSSGVRIELELGRLPLAPGVEAVARALDVDPAEFAATAGEDFELCACLSPAVPRSGGAPILEDSARPPLTVIGRVVEGRPGLVLEGAGSELAGYEH